jgi:hypothetical protein
VVENPDINQWITEYIITTHPPLGEPKVTEYFDASGHLCSLGVVYDPISVPYPQAITIGVETNLNTCNDLVITDFDWSFDTGDPREAAPDHGFAFDDQFDLTKQDWADGFHDSKYTFLNLDPNVPITLTALVFYHDDQWLEPSEQRNRLGDPPFLRISGPIVVYPEGSYPVPLLDIPYDTAVDPGSYIYVSGDMAYQLNGSDPETIHFFDGHQEELPIMASISRGLEWLAYKQQNPGPGYTFDGGWSCMIRR